MNRIRLMAAVLGAWLAVLPCATWAAMGLDTIAATAEDGPVTLYYPTRAAEQTVPLDRFSLSVATQAAPERGNGRLIVISHGSGGSPWMYADLARSLVEAGFVVAMPEHRADNHKDASRAGPDSWATRPAEVSRAVDAVSRDPRFAPSLSLDKVGMYGMSAGGHTALSLAGGRWSPARFKQHCEDHLVDDPQTCMGLVTQLTGGVLDGVKKWATLLVIRNRFDDSGWREHTDPRIAAIVAGVPAAADFDMASLATSRVPLALITAKGDRWLTPRFHSDRVLQACKPCEHLAELPGAGHGALLSPLPPGLTGLAGDMLNDPPGYDRARVTAEVNGKITAYFKRHLLR
jgi:predicted dienelactone hydrolase